MTKLLPFEGVLHWLRTWFTIGEVKGSITNTYNLCAWLGGQVKEFRLSNLFFYDIPKPIYYLPTHQPQNIIFDNYFQKINYLNLGKNLTCQMVCYYTIKKDHPSHDRHVKINLSKMTKQSFDLVQKGFFYQMFQLKKPYFSMNVIICKVKKKLYGHDNSSLGC